MIELTECEREFLARVQVYCEGGLNQAAMALREGVTLSSFRDRLQRLGFSIQAETSRQVVRTRTRETLASLLANGTIRTAEPAQVG